jgi:NAD-dependent dihydropyrimidine dehydrogenase PreA subunit
MKLKLKANNWPRPVMQWGVIVFVVILALLPRFNENFKPDFEAYCPFGGIQALGSYLLNQALSCSMTSAQIVMGIILFISILILSKLFCSYICPIGTFTEWLGKLGDRLKIRLSLSGWLDKVLRSIKYILLFITLYYSFGTNELFCKKYDPYFAITTGFSMDVEVLYASIAITLAILGSVFIRLFWCKYLCPLGAISNIFKFTFFFVAIVAIYIILLQLGIELSYIWPLAIACSGGYLIEIIGKYNKFIPIFRVTRNESSCIDCQLCSKTCPQKIDVASLKVVKDADCNLCGDCLHVCPVENTMQVNKRTQLKWLPPVATIVLIVAGLLLGKVWEVPTIDMKWYDEDVMAKAEVFTQSGLKNIKCYGSSMSFASKMKKVNGVLGVATYVKHKRAKVYYDPSKLTESKIQELLFTPQKKPLRLLQKNDSTIIEYTVLLENFFDVYDFNYLSILLEQKTKAIGVISEFNCPVIAKIYFPESQKIDISELRNILETETLTYDYKDKKNIVDLNYKVALEITTTTVNRGEYIENLFSPYVASFNKASQYHTSVVKTFTIPLNENRKKRNQFKFLVSHLSNDKGVIEFSTFLNEKHKEDLQIKYVDSLTNIQNIKEALQADTLIYTYRNGEIGKMKNIFEFNE